MTIKLQRYYTDAISTHSDWDGPAQLVCKDADVSALEAENERLREAITKYIKQLHCESEVCSELHLPEAATTAHVHAKDLEAILNREQEKL